MSAPIPIPIRIICGTVMLTGGCVFGGIAIPMLRKSYKRASKGVATQGIIVGSEFHRDFSNGRSLYLPKVEFETVNGEKITFVSGMGSNADPKIGRKVKVSYLPDKPQDADIVSLGRSWLFPLCFLVGAVFFLLMSIMFYTAFLGDAA